MFTRPMNPRVGAMRNDEKRRKLIDQIARQKAAGRFSPAIARCAKQRFGGFGSMARSMGGGHPLLGRGGEAGARNFLPMPMWGAARPGGNPFGLAPVEPGLPGAAPDFAQQIQDRAVGGDPGLRPDASGPINWSALGIPDPGAPQHPVGPMPSLPQGTQTMDPAGRFAGLAAGVGQAPSTAGNLVPLGNGMYLDPATGVVHGVGGVSMM